MRIALALVLVLLAAPAARAAGIDETPGAPAAPALQPEVVRETPAAPAMHLREVRVPAPARSEAEAADAAQSWPARGSFWWMVGVLVVAALIVHVVIN